MHNAPVKSRKGQQIADAEDLSEDDGRTRRPGRSMAPASHLDWLSVLISNWKLVVVGALAGLLGAGVYLGASPRQYASEALIAPTRSITQVQFEPKIQTVSGGTSSPQSSTSSLTPERRQALVDLVRSSDLEQKVIRALQGQLPADELKPGELMQRIRGNLRPRSEILSIQAESTTPEAAVAITNAWATSYVDQVNRIYASTGPDNSLQALLTQAQQQLQEAQTALTNSIRVSHLEQLDSDILDREHRLALLQSPYQAGAFAQNDSPITTLQRQQSQQQATISATRPQSPVIDASTARSDYRLVEVRTLDDLAQTIRRLDATRENVRALVDQQSTSDSASNGVALTLLKAQLVSISDGLPAQTQIQLPASNSVSPDELKSLAANIDQARARVAAEFETRRAAYEQNRATQITSLEQELRDLRSQREQADGQRKQLTLQRDVASDTYAALARKVEEDRVAQGTAGHEVELASLASFASPASKSPPIVLTGSLLAGIFIAAAIALARSALRNQSNKLSTVRHYQTLDRQQTHALNG